MICYFPTETNWMQSATDALIEHLFVCFTILNTALRYRIIFLLLVPTSSDNIQYVLATTGTTITDREQRSSSTERDDCLDECPCKPPARRVVRKYI